MSASVTPLAARARQPGAAILKMVRKGENSRVGKKLLSCAVYEGLVKSATAGVVASEDAVPKTASTPGCTFLAISPVVSPLDEKHSIGALQLKSLAATKVA